MNTFQQRWEKYVIVLNMMGISVSLILLWWHLLKADDMVFRVCKACPNLLGPRFGAVPAATP